MMAIVIDYITYGRSIYIVDNQIVANIIFDMTRSHDEVTSLIGRELYTVHGICLGTVEDIALDFKHEIVRKIAVTDLNPDLFDDLDEDARGILIPYRWVRAVNDVIIIEHRGSRKTYTANSQQEGVRERMA